MSLPSGKPIRSAAVTEVIADVRRKGVTLWVQDGALRYRGPKGVLTAGELEVLKVASAEVVSILQHSTSENSLGHLRQRDFAPLSFSQLKYWNAARLYEQPSARSIASTLRLCGVIDVVVIQDVLRRMLRRHEALRTRVFVKDGVPAQMILDSCECDFSFDDLGGISEQEVEARTDRAIQSFITQRIRVVDGPLVALKLIKVAKNEHVLMVAMEHIISDMFSLRVFLKEFFFLYEQITTSSVTVLPAVGVHQADCAAWLREGHDEWLAKHGKYWETRLRGCQRLRFPDAIGPVADYGMLAFVKFELGKDLKEKLAAWSRQHRTTLAIALFTAYVSAVLRWCRASDGVFPYQTDGRFNASLENSIGYFASVLHLRVTTCESDTFLDLLASTTAEYRTAYEHNDFCYIAAQTPTPGFVGNPGFNWIPLSSTRDALSPSTLTVTPLAVEFPLYEIYGIDVEPGLLLRETEGGIDGYVIFPRHRFETETMERFARNFSMFVTTLLYQPEKSVASIALL